MMRLVIELYGKRALTWSWVCVRHFLYDAKFRKWFKELIERKADDIDIGNISHFLDMDDDNAHVIFQDDIPCMILYDVLIELLCKQLYQEG